MLSAFPLFTGTNGYFLLGQNKFLLFSVATGLWCILLAVGAVIRMLRGERLRIFRSDLYLLLFAAAAVLSTVRSPYAGSFFSFKSGRYDGLWTYLLYCLILLGVSHFGRPNRRQLIVFSVAYGLNCVVAVLQLLGKNALGLYPDGMNYYAPYVQEMAPFLGTIGNIDLCSALHCLAIPVLLLAIVLGKDNRRFALLLPLLLGMACAYAAGVASGGVALFVLLCVLAALLPLLLHERFGLFPDKTTGRLFLAGCIPTAAAVFVLLLIVRELPMPDGTLSELQAVLHGELLDEFGSHRIEIWRGCWETFLRHPVTGIGPDQLVNALEIQFTRYSELLETEIVTIVDQAHNEYLQHLVSFGIVGFLPMLLLQIRTLIGVFRSRPICAPENLILFAACLCYMVQGNFNVGFCLTTPLLCIAWGLLLGSVNGVQREQEAAASAGSGKTLNISFYAQTNIGAVRKNNEDNYCINSFVKEDTDLSTQELSGCVEDGRALLGVFDGMGGFAHGEQASLLAALTARQYFAGDNCNVCTAFYAAANEEVCAYAFDNMLEQCGTTAALLEIRDGNFCCSNVGDSRIYLLRRGKLTQLTTDDSEYERLRSIGVANPNCGKNLLTQYLGVPPEEFVIEPHITSLAPLRSGDRFLLCSDGLTGSLADEELCRFLRAKAAPKTVGERLIRTALNNHERDNITVVVADVK